MNPYLIPALILSVIIGATVEAADTVVKTYIIAGQSNANGFGLASGQTVYGTPLSPNKDLAGIGRADLTITQNTAYIFKGGSASGLGKWTNMGPGYGTDNGARFGPELSFSKQLQTNADEQLAIIKYSPDGTSLYADWKPNVAASNRYDYFIKTVNNAKAAAAARGWALEIKGVLWMQGESDSFGVDAPAAYQQNLSSFISSVRSDLNLPNLTFHIAQIADTAFWPARQQIWSAQQAVTTADNNAHLVNGKDLPLFTDDGIGNANVHYTTEGTVLLGERFASSVASAETVLNNSAYPESVEDNASTTKNKPVTIDVLANDVGSDLRITDINNYSAKGGTVKLVADKTLYTPKLGFVGDDTFWYAFVDAIGRTNSAKVTIAVTNPASDAYPVGNPDTATTVLGHLITIDVLANDTGDQLKLNNANPWSLRGGNVAIVNNKVNYIPKPNFEGVDKIWYLFSDSKGRSNSGEVTITVSENAPYPVAITDNIEVVKNTAGTFDVLANDIGIGLSIEVNDYTVNGGRTTIVDGKVSYTPKPNYVGQDSFWYAIKDYRGRTNAIRVTVMISN